MSHPHDASHESPSDHFSYPSRVEEEEEHVRKDRRERSGSNFLSAAQQLVLLLVQALHCVRVSEVTNLMPVQDKHE